MTGTGTSVIEGVGVDAAVADRSAAARPQAAGVRAACALVNLHE
jgi:hypothetical protein